MSDLDTADQPSTEEVSNTANLASLLGVSDVDPPDEEPQDTAPHDGEPAPVKAEEAPAEDEEVDLGDVKLKLPKDQAEAVRKAALRQADYTRKTMELAEQRKAIDGEAQRAAQERAQYAQGLAQLRAQVEHAVNTGQLQPPSPDLLESDPVAYLRQRDQWERAQQAYNAARHQQEQINQQQEHERRNQIASRLQTEQEQLIAKLPDWKDAGKAQADQKAIGDYLQTIGFTPDEVAQVQDHRGVLMAREAMLYRKMVAEQKSLAQKKVASAPPAAIKPGATQDRADTQINQSAVKRLKASGGRDMDSASAALKSLLYGA